ncbi:MAG: hypothetical protein RJA10_1836 [Pseudomonadota bacterium]|jgi:5'-deoxynucleotidase YfbR-like HD superfamily hydrolase
MRTDIQTAAGRYFDLLRPGDNDFGIEEIAHALSHICRFTGHTRQHYSVAQHSWLVSWLVPAEFALHGLLHDAAEAFVGDVSSPLKRQLPVYKVIECDIENTVLGRFGLWGRCSPDSHRAVKQADLVALVTEQRDLMPPRGDGDWSNVDGIEPLPWTIEPLPSFMAKALFLRRFEQLGGVR